MLKTFKKWWRYLGAKMGMKFEERADPKVQLEQALVEAQEQHRRLKEQAANVIANQKQTDMQLSRKMEELEKVNGSARQAVLMPTTPRSGAMLRRRWSTPMLRDLSRRA